MPKEIALQIKSSCDSANAIADILRRHPKHSIDNLVIDALMLIGADTKTMSEIAIKVKHRIKDCRERYVMVHKDLIQ